MAPRLARSLRSAFFRRYLVMVISVLLLVGLGARMAPAQWPVWQAGDLQFQFPNPGKADGVSAGGQKVGALGMFLIVYFFVENQSGTERTLDLNAFSLTDARGQTYRPVPDAMATYSQLKGWSGSLSAQTLPSHFRRNLAVIFDVSRGDHDFQLTIPGRSASVPLRVP
jgi:hypothetical protein